MADEEMADAERGDEALKIVLIGFITLSFLPFNVKPVTTDDWLWNILLFLLTWMLFLLGLTINSGQ